MATPSRERALASAPATRRHAIVLLVAVVAGLAGLVVDPAPAGAVDDPIRNTVVGFAGAPQLGPFPGRVLNAPFVDATPTRGRGYWAVAGDGGVFSFGDAHFHGSTSGIALHAPVDGIAATPSGAGYWLAAADGGVFAFGDARFFGSAARLRLLRPVVGIAPTRTGDGYYLVAADGGVFAFGDARFLRAAIDPGRPVSGIAVTLDGAGYWVARADGAVEAYGSAGDARAPFGTGSETHPTVAIMAAPDGYWLVQGVWDPPPPPPPPDLSQDPFLVCTRAHESDGAGGYRAVSPGGTYRGAYQFTRSTWDTTARYAGRFDLVGVDPAVASPADQDFLALTLYRWQGAAPWGGRCAGLP